MKPLHIRLLVLVVLISPLISIFSQNAIIPSVKIKDHKDNTDAINVDCDYDFLINKGIRLTATYPDIRQTNSYTVSSIDYAPVTNFNQGDIADIKDAKGKEDDTYSNVINLPFAFCFYGNSYSQIIISDNGVVSFNTVLIQQECPYAPPNPTPTGLPKNSIFGVFHDMQNIKQVRYLVDGIAPNRRFIINYNDIPQYSYPMAGKNSTSQIVLYETTNIIDVYVKDRFKNESNNAVFDGNGAYRKNAVIGLTNYDSSGGIAPPNRDTGNWEAHNEAWRFTPAGSSNITIQWLNQFGSEVSGTRNAKSILVYPTQSTTYKVQVNFNMCVPLTVTDAIDIQFSQDFPTATEITTNGFCINNDGTHTLDLTSYEPQINPDPTLSFSYFENQNLTTPILSKEAYEFSNNKTVYVKVLKSGVCYSVGKLNLKLNKRPVITTDQSFEKCDTENDGKETLNLNTLGITGLSGSNYKFYESLAAANAGTPEITNYSNYLINVAATSNNTQTLYLRAWNTSYNDPTCYTIVPFKIKLKNYIEVKKPTAPFLICHVTEGQLIKNYDLTQYEPQLLDNPNTGVIFEYFTTSNYTSSYKIANPALATFTMNTTIYIKATKAGYCDAYTQIKLAADDDCDGTAGGGGGGGGGATGPGGPGGGGGPICDTNEASVTVNLDDDYLKFYLQGRLTLSDITILGFYNSANNSLLTTTAPYSYTFSPPFFLVIQARYKINATGVESYVNFPVSASKKASITPDTFDICDTYNDDQEIITVKSTNNPKPKWQTNLESAYPQATIYFFSSNNDLNNYIAAPDNPDNSSKIITRTTITPPSKVVYVYVKYYGCIYTHEIKFNLLPVLIKQTSPYIICDFDDDKKELINIIKVTNNETHLKNQITAQQLIGLQSPIRYYKTLNQAHAGATDFITNLTNFEINTSQMSVFARLNIQDECAVIVELKFQFTTSVALPVLKNLTICDTNNDNQEEVKLTDAIVSTNPNAQITFYGTSDAAEAGDETSPYFISATVATDYRVTVSPTTIYIRVYDQITTCWKILSFTVTLIQTPVLTNKMIKTCDTGNDEKEILTSAYMQAQLINNNNTSISPGMTYKFYETQADAISNTVSSLTTFEVTKTNSVWVNIAQRLGDCPIIEELKFTLVKPPILETRALVYTICNNNTGNENGTIKENIILDSYKNDILGFSASSTYTFAYYNTTENDAIAGGTFGKVSSAYTVTSFPKTIWARVTNTSTGCFSTKSMVFQQTPSLVTAIADSEIIACSNGEMSKEINLEDYPSQMIIAPANLNDFHVSYHNSRTNAVNNINLTTDITHYIATPASEIWLKFVSKITGCYIIKKLSVTIYSTPKAQDVFPEICDETDGKLDGNYGIPNLDIYKNQIITGEPNLELLYTFTYYDNMADATAKSANTISPTNYTFNETNLQSGPYPDPDCYTHTVYTRIDKQDNTGCFSVVAIAFQINKKVTLHAEQSEILSCDESDNDGKSNFDLTTVQDQISTTLGVTFKYYPTKDDAQNNTNEITNLNNWQNQTPYEHIVYVRTAASGYCDNIASVKLKVYPYIQVVDYANEGYCEFESDGLTKRTVNLLTEVENMTTQINSNVLYTNLSDDIDIHFYTTLTDAQQQNLINSIPTQSLTTYLFPVGLTDLWVRFQSKTTDCFEIKKLSITIFDTPNTQDITPQVCDETDGKLDGNFVIPDLHAFKNQIITNEPNLDNLYTFTYYKNQADAFAQNSNTISNLNYTFTEADLLTGIAPAPDSHTIYTRIDKQDNTGCFSVAAISFQIKKKVPVNSEQPEILNCDESHNDGKTNFDLTTVENQISTTLGVTFKYYPTRDDAQNNTNEITNLNNWQNQTPYEHIVYVRTAASGYCDNIASIKLKVYPYIQVVDYANEGYCEFESDGLTKRTVNLLTEVENMTTQINSNVLYTNLSDDIDIHFYTTLTDAQQQNLINSIPTESLTTYLFPVGLTDLWVRFQSKTTDCFEIKKLSITIFDTPNTQDITPEVCDETDGKLDGNFVIPDLHAYKNQIITNEPNLDNLYTFTYYKNQADAFAQNSNTISNLNYTFTETDLLTGIAPAPDSHTICTRIDKQDNTGCFSVAAISFQIKKKVPVNSEQPEVLNCDESDNDGKTNFDLTTVENQISTTLGVTFKYYPTRDDAQNNTNEITNLNSWQNQTPYEHIVYVRTAASGYCDNIASIKLKVYPYIQAVDYITEYCEFESDGLTETTANLLVEVENITVQINSITQYPTLSDDIDIHFYNSLADAQNPTLINSISTVDLTDYSFPVGTTTIWVHFQSKTTKCFEIKKMTLKKLKAPEVNTEVIPFRCSPENDLLDAVVKITPLDSNKIYTYSFDNGLTFSNTGTFNTNQSETIHYIVSDANGCKISGNIFVPGYNPPTGMDIQTATIYCNTSNNHPIITVNNVSSPATGTTYTYEIIEPAGIALSNTTGVFSGLSPEIYQIKATDDATKCYIIKSVEVIKAPEITVAVQSHIDVLCHAESTGAITYAISNFITSSNYSYELIPNLLGLTPDQTGDIITYEGLTAGNYTFKVTDNLSGCTSEVTDFTISQPIAPLTFTGIANNITCNNSNDGKIVITANGGTGSVKYAISPNLTHFDDQFEFTNLTPGTYQIAVQDQAGCSGNGLLTLEIIEPSILSAQVTGPILQEMCDGDQDGSFNISISGGTPPYSVCLDDENGIYTSVLGSQFDFTNLSGGRHKVFIRDTYCSTELEVIMDKAVTLNPEVKIDYDCLNNIAINSVTVKIHPDNANPDDVDYALDDDTNFKHSNVFENVASGTHTITVRHSNGCQQTTIPFTVDEIKKLSLTLSEGGLNEIIATADGGYGGYQYSINGEAYSFTNKIIIYKSGIYVFEATDKKGCTVTISKYVEYVDLCIPNHFTPNGDGINDTWAPGCTINYTNLTYDIIDRYGRIICKYRLGQEWDGKYNGTELPSGDYWYLIKLNDPNDNREFIGHFTLYR